MPAALISREQVVERLLEVFRDRGFEGASLSDLSRATGLGKSSLYHYFPGGKDQMAEVVLARAADIVDQGILAVARNGDSLKARLGAIASALRAFYSNGTTACVLGQLSGAGLSKTARASLRTSFDNWIQAIEVLAIDAGFTPARAHRFAQDWVGRLQGALILHAATADTAPFDRALKALLDLAKT